jgi:DNA-binding MarR family transcriptional regulator
MSFASMDWVLKHSRAEGTDRWILFLIAYRANPDNENCCWPSISKIAVDSGLSPRTVVRSIKSLLASGELVGERRFDAKGHRKTNLYHLAAFSKDESLSANLSPKDESLSANLPRDKMPRDILSPRIVIESNKTKETPKPEQEKASSERTYEPLAIPKPQKHSKQNLPRFASRAIYRETATPTALASWDAEGFEAFWQAYPKQVGRVRALREWNLMRPPIEEVLAGIAVWKKSSDWKRESGQFIHTPARFLEDQIWKENPEPRIERSLSKHEEREKRNKEVARRAIERSHCRTPARVRDALAPRPN